MDARSGGPAPLGEPASRRNSFLSLSLILGIASAGCAAMVLARWILTMRVSHRFLLWNLFLAWTPYLISLLLIPAGRAKEKARRRVLTALIGIAWLFFFPNSPYIFTDLIHVIQGGFRTRGAAAWITPEALLWYEIILNVMFAFTGHFIGLISLYIVHGSMRRAWGRAAGWTVTSLAVLLSGMGIFLGRFARLNSWDAFRHPLVTVGAAARAFLTPRALLFSLAFAFFIGSTYAMLYIFKAVRIDPPGSGLSDRPA